MNLDFKMALNKRLRLLEGDEEFPYEDIEGNITIGIGYNLTANGLPFEMREALCNSHIEFCFDKLLTTFPWFGKLNEARQTALIDMAYHMGWYRFLKFKEMLNYLNQGDLANAGKELLNSNYGRKFKTRATKNYILLVNGQSS